MLNQGLRGKRQTSLGFVYVRMVEGGHEGSEERPKRAAPKEGPEIASVSDFSRST